MRDPTWADTLLAVFLIAWAVFVVFGGLGALGWWFGGIFSTEPGVSLTVPLETGPPRQATLEPATTAYTPPRSGDYIVYDDPDSTAQVLEDDREWHHDRRHREGHGVCPECGATLRSPG